MAIKAYTGIMGAGKTYEVVVEVIYKALARGRRVVSNIAGLNFEEFKRLLVEDGIDPDRIGELVCVEHLAVLEPMFWRTDTDGPEVVTVIQPGDLVALDEVWRFWDGLGLRDSDGKKRPDRVMNFFRMHRQMPNPVTGVTCDVAVICQDIADLHRSVKGVVEETYVMTKLTVIGASNRYRVEVFQKTRTNRKPIAAPLQRSYDSRFFPCYKSHSQKVEGGADVVEENIDGRGNILKGALFKVVLPLMIPVLGLAIWGVWGFFHPKQKPAEAVPAAASAPIGGKASAAPVASPPLQSDKWRIVGWYRSADVVRVVLTDGQTTRFIVAPPNYKETSMTLELELPEGGFATTWGGAVVPVTHMTGPKP